MDPIILDEINFSPLLEDILHHLHVKEESQEELVIRLVEEANQVARPKAIYTLAGIEGKFEGGVILNGIRFESQVLRINLDQVHRVFPYISTCGRELYEWKESKQDLLGKYYAEEISQLALNSASDYLLEHLHETYGLTKTSSMNPGSLDDWPVTAQPSLFQLLGNPLEAIGVELLESMLMIPNQTVSGIQFEAEQDFSSCQLCPREICSHRRAPFDQDLLEKKYQ